MRKRSLCYVARALCAALLACMVMSCGETTPTPAPTPLQPSPTPEPSPPTVAAPAPTVTRTNGTVDPRTLLPYIPDSADVPGALRAELDGDAEPEVAVLLGRERVADGLGYGFLQLMVLELDRAPDDVVAWQSDRLVGERGEGLRTRDLNGDGRDEVLSYQSMGAAPPEARGAVATGYTLYVLGWRDGQFGLFSAQGGYFDGQDHFGDVGVWVEDIDRDGVYEILASYGPAGTSTDVYQWDGEEYAYAITLHDK